MGNGHTLEILKSKGWISQSPVLSSQAPPHRGSETPGSQGSPACRLCSGGAQAHPQPRAQALSNPVLDLGGIEPPSFSFPGWGPGLRPLPVSRLPLLPVPVLIGRASIKVDDRNCHQQTPFDLRVAGNKGSRRKAALLTDTSVEQLPDCPGRGGGR